MSKIIKTLKTQNSFLHFVSGDKYHNIYYRGDIDIVNIMNLTRIIQEQNNKYAGTNHKKISKNPIKLHITSNGGDCEAGLMAYDLIKQSRFPVYTFCEGYSCSAATFLFLAGQKRFMLPHSKLLIHQLSYGCHGTHTNMTDQMYNNNLIMADMKKMYLRETKLDEKSLDDLLRKDIYLTAKECLKYGFVHKIM
jgi:ATP-dependent Clp protease protease subunit